MIFPTEVGWIIGIGTAWVGLTTGVRAYGQALRARAEEREAERAMTEEREKLTEIQRAQSTDGENT
jgi:hypothetical protein